MNEWLKKFIWDSEDQRVGYLAFLTWAKKKRVTSDVSPIDLFFIQKDHESDVYWREFLGDQVRRLEDQVRILQSENASLRGRVNAISDHLAGDK